MDLVQNYQIHMVVSFYGKKRLAYSVDIKNKAVEMKLQGYSTKQIMQELNIKNETQVETWFRWYKNGETHRFHQQVEKQYSYNKNYIKYYNEKRIQQKLDYLSPVEYRRR